MEKLISKVYEEKLQDGSIENIISQEIEKMVKECCCDLFSWNGVIKKQMEEKIKDLMGGVLERSDFSKYTIKLTKIINEILPNTALADYKQITDNLKCILEEKAMTTRDTIKLSEIFKKYCDFMEGLTFYEVDLEDEDSVEYDEYKTATLTTRMEMHGGQIVFYTEGLENGEKYRYKLRRWNNHVRYDKDFKLSEFEMLDSFSCFIMMLSNNFVKIEFDIKEDYDEVNVTIED